MADLPALLDAAAQRTAAALQALLGQAVAKNGLGPAAYALARGASAAALAASGSRVAGTTLLHFCAAKGQTELCSLLLSAGAETAAEDASGRGALHWAAYNGRALACRLLLERGAAVGLSGAAGTALHLAAGAGQLECASILLQHGADPRAADPAGVTPLQLAREATMRALLEAPPPPRAPPPPELAAAEATAARAAEQAADVAAAETRGYGAAPVLMVPPPEQGMDGEKSKPMTEEERVALSPIAYLGTIRGFASRQVINTLVKPLPLGYDSDHPRAFTMPAYREQPTAFVAIEESSCCARCCLGGGRAFTVHVRTADGGDVMRLERPASCCTCAPPGMSVFSTVPSAAPEGDPLGVIVLEPGCCSSPGLIGVYDAKVCYA